MPPKTASMVMTQYSRFLYRCIGINGRLRGMYISETVLADLIHPVASAQKHTIKDEDYDENDTNDQRCDDMCRAPGV